MLPEAVGHQTEPHGVVNMRWQDPRGEPIIIKRKMKVQGMGCVLTWYTFSLIREATLTRLLSPRPLNRGSRLTNLSARAPGACLITNCTHAHTHLQSQGVLLVSFHGWVVCVKEQSVPGAGMC